MPRRYSRRSRRGSMLPLVVLLVLVILLLVVIQNRNTLNVPLGRVNLPNIVVPITDLPKVQVPTLQVALTIVPGTLMPQVGINGTQVPGIPISGAPALGQRTKSAGCQVQGALPDPACTPGAVMNVNTDQVCQKGYASSVRNVPVSESDQVYAEYGIANHSAGQYEVDHLVPLELGGSNDLANLWPEAASPRPGFHEKDALENYLHDKVCSGGMSLADAQNQIATNWLAAYNQMPK